MEKSNNSKYSKQSEHRKEYLRKYQKEYQKKRYMKNKSYRINKINK